MTHPLADKWRKVIEAIQGVWIPVSERLPVIDQQVWVYCGEGTTAFAIWTDKGWCYGNPGPNDKMYSFDLMSQTKAVELGLEFLEPTHWMPLPLPPEEIEALGLDE